ncbi:MAG: hypothetical protein IKQ81_00260 [Clostridiales bacterium]|jgi:hypothetical protein|nr:hypothetical protein [Clostridiales bacterium]
MKAYMKETMAFVRKYIDEEMQSAPEDRTRKVLAEFEKKISFFQHERLIHLIVTFFFALFLLMEIYALFTLPFSYAPVCGVLVVLFFVLVVAYVFHYYFLENSVQQMYKMRDEITRFLDPDVKA